MSIPNRCLEMDHADLIVGYCVCATKLRFRNGSPELICPKCDLIWLADFDSLSAQCTGDLLDPDFDPANC